MSWEEIAMAWSDYITTVKEQIRNNKAKLLIEDELKDHFEEQIKAFQEDGLSYAKAEEKTILDMGDPVIVGTEFNRIHRPKLEKKLLITVILFSSISLFVQFVVGSVIDLATPNYFHTQAVYILIGIGIMVFIYYMDYTVIGRYPFLLWGILTVLGLFFLRYGPRGYNGFVHLYTITLLFVPIFAGILYRLRNLKLTGLILSGVIGAIPILLALLGKSISVIIHYMVIYLIMLNVSVGKRWFGNRKIGFAVVWAGTIGVPSLFILICLKFSIPLLSDYQITRLKVLFTDFSSEDFLYQSNTARQALVNSKIFGGSSELITRVPVVESDYILVFIFSMFGIFVGICVVALLLFLLYKAFRIAKVQKSYLGYMVGMACTLIFLVETFFYVVNNLLSLRVSILISQQALPFLSGGARNIIFSYAIVGLLLSVYRNSELVSDRTHQKKRNWLQRKKDRIISIKVNN